MKGSEVLVWIAGTRWDEAVPGTDRRLVTAVAKRCRVLWIDPPIPWRPGRRTPTPRITEVAAGVTRVRVIAPPGVTRPGIRVLTAAILERAVMDAVREIKVEAIGVLVSFPLASFPKDLAGTKILYVTDDWLGGSEQLGLSKAAVHTVLVSNLKAADVVMTVSPFLSMQLDGLSSELKLTTPSPRVLPNGCPAPLSPARPESRHEPVVGVVGQLNERLDLNVLEAVRSTGVDIRVIGPRVEATRGYQSRMTAFLRSPNVSWFDAIPASKVPAELARLGVGLTPYADTAFNRASFPLKTLEYLAAGVAVVSTDLPSVRWLASDLIRVSSDPTLFAHLVTAALEEKDDEALNARRRKFASSHTWEHRADELLAILN